MKYLGYVLRNAGRNPVRTTLTIASMTTCLFLMMMLATFLEVNGEVSSSLREYNRIVVMSSQGFAQPVPYARVNEIAAMDGVQYATPFSWYGGKYNEEVMPFAQFGVNPDTIFKIYDELTITDEYQKAFSENRQGAIIGRKLAEERKLSVGSPLPLKADLYPIDLTLTVVGIYDGSPQRDLRMVFFNWDYLNESLKSAGGGKMLDNAGVVIVKCKTADSMPTLSTRIDASYLNSNTPTRTQTEEAFNQMFLEMFGDLRGMIRNIGLAVVFSLICVSANAMAMALRERTTEVAVLKAIGFGKSLVIGLVLSEAVIVSGLGGLVGAIGSKLFFDVVDISKFASNFLPFFFVSWSTALYGLALSLLIGFASGVIPAVRAARLSVIDGLRKVG